MAAAVVVATEARADALGVPADRRVYLRGPGGAAEPATMAARPEPWRSPAMATGHAIGHGRGVRRPDRPPRPLLVLRQLAGVRRRRPRHRVRARPHRHRRPPLSRGPGQQLHHPRAGGHDRGAPRRSGLARAGERDRDAHDQPPRRRAVDPPRLVDHRRQLHLRGQPRPAADRAGDAERPAAAPGCSPTPRSTPARDPSGPR